MTIHLGVLLPTRSSSQPGSLGGSTLAIARETPIWLCSWRGLPCLWGYPQSGGLLPHRFTLTPQAGWFVFCGAIPWVAPAGH